MQPELAYLENISRNALAKAAFRKNIPLFTSKLDLNLRKKLVKCYIWSMALYGVETLTLYFYCILDIPLPLVSKEYFIICHTIGPTDLLHNSPAPCFKTFQVCVVYFPKCQSFNTVQSHAPNVALY